MLVTSDLGIRRVKNIINQFQNPGIMICWPQLKSLIPDFGYLLGSHVTNSNMVRVTHPGARLEADDTYNK